MSESSWAVVTLGGGTAVEIWGRSLLKAGDLINRTQTKTYVLVLQMGTQMKYTLGFIFLHSYSQGLSASTMGNG